MASIFISYRRDDSAGHAGRLYDRLSDHFGPDQVFMDVDTIRPGQDFVDAVRQAVEGCDGLIAIIGREWLTISDAAGSRRIDDPKDIVSLEISTALEQGIRVIPVLVQGASMPTETDLPKRLNVLAYRNAQEIGDRSFHSDAQSLIEALEAPEPERPERNDFIGRRGEMAELRSALDAAMAGRGQMVMLAGEPGIGKTRVAKELASRAESLGAQVMWGWCYEHVGAPPYWLYVQPIRTYVESAEAGQLSSQMGLGGPAIAEIVPELRTKLPDLGQPIAAEPEQARFRLFDSIAAFLKNAAQIQPLILVVDDLHWADSSSLLMLEFLVKEIATSPVFVLGTYRDGEVTGSHPLLQTLGNLVREPHYRRVQLGGLTREEVGKFVENSKGVTLPDDALETVHSRTEGNPLFMTEVVELIDPGQITENRAWADVIPGGVRDAIGSRLNRLSPTCNQVLETASVIGREFEVSLLVTLDSDINREGVLTALDEALESKVIEESTSEAGRFQFRHALIQQALYDEMPSIRKLRAHASIGESLEQVHQSNLEVYSGDLARHFGEAESLLGSEKLVHYSIMAGERALATYAYEDSLTHFQNGLNATAAEPMGPARAALFSGLGRAQAVLQDPEALAALSSAFEYYVEIGDVDHVVAIAEYPDYGTWTRRTGMGNVLAQALELVAPDSREAARLLPRYGQYLGLQQNDYQGAREALDRALVIARREKDIALEMRTLSAAVSVYTNHMRNAECIENSKLAIDLATEVDDPRSELAARYAAATSLIATGDLQGARKVVSGMLAPAERLRDRFWLYGTFWKHEVNHRLAGDWSAAREFGKRGLATDSNPSLVLEDLVLMEYEVGDFDLGRKYLDQLIEIANAIQPGIPFFEFGMAGMVLSLTARTANDMEKLALAESTAQTAVASPTTPPTGTERARTGLAMLSVLQDDAVAAAQYYDTFVPHKGIELFFAISSDRLLGLLSQTMGNLDRSADHFEDSLAFCRRAGYRPELAWACCDYSDMLRARNENGDALRAKTLMEESLAISSELGMLPLMERAAARLESIES